MNLTSEGARYGTYHVRYVGIAEDNWTLRQRIDHTSCEEARIKRFSIGDIHSVRNGCDTRDTWSMMSSMLNQRGSREDLEVDLGKYCVKIASEYQP